MARLEHDPIEAELFGEKSDYLFTSSYFSDDKWCLVAKEDGLIGKKLKRFAEDGQDWQVLKDELNSKGLVIEGNTATGFYNICIDKEKSGSDLFENLKEAFFELADDHEHFEDMIMEDEW